MSNEVSERQKELKELEIELNESNNKLKTEIQMTEDKLNRMKSTLFEKEMKTRLRITACKDIIYFLDCVSTFKKKVDELFDAEEIGLPDGNTGTWTKLEHVFVGYRLSNYYRHADGAGIYNNNGGPGDVHCGEEHHMVKGEKQFHTYEAFKIAGSLTLTHGEKYNQLSLMFDSFLND